MPKFQPIDFIKNILNIDFSMRIERAVCRHYLLLDAQFLRIAVDFEICEMYIEMN